MSTSNVNSINTYLKYTQLQMAAEAFWMDNSGALIDREKDGKKYVAVLTAGNKRTTRFMQQTAEEFAKNWEVIDHRPNTRTGFSGTLFRALHDDAQMGIKAGVVRKQTIALEIASC